MRLTQTSPIFIRSGPSCQTHAFTEEHRRHFTPRIIPVSVHSRSRPCGAYPGSNLYFPTVFATAPLRFSLAPAHPRTKPLGAWGLGPGEWGGREEEEEDGNTHNHGLHVRGQLSWALALL